MKKILKRTALTLLITVLVAAVALAADIAYCYYALTVREYSITSDKLKTDLRIVLIADTHLKEFGRDNVRLIDKIEEQNPDIIAVAGDLNLETTTEYQSVLTLLEGLVKIAPVYYTLGNHELALLDDTDFVSDVKKTGAHLLINESEYFEKDGEKILIGGIKQYPYLDSLEEPEKSVSEETYFLNDFLEKEKENYGILLCHYPEFYMWKFSEYDIDLMLSGHTHGGLVRLPGIGGLYAPEQGWYPQYDMGLFQSDTATMVITAGLHNSNVIPRINNPGEVCVININ